MASNSDEQGIIRGTKDLYDDSLSLTSITSQAFDEREFILKLLNDKRTLLAALHNEKKEKLKWKGEFEKKSEALDQVVNGVVSGNQTGSCSPRLSTLNLNDDTELNRLYKKLREKDDKIREIQSKNDRLLNQVAVLKSEVIRLARTLARMDTVHEPSMDPELLREQLELYEEDFKKEKDDKVVAQEKLSVLTEQLRDNQEMIQNLTVELDMYKKAYEREKLEKEKNLLRTATGSDNSLRENSTLDTSRRRPDTSLPEPHLQVVYPVTNDREQFDEQRRRRQLHQVGVLTRDIQRSSTYDTNRLEPSYWWST